MLKSTRMSNGMLDRMGSLRARALTCCVGSVMLACPIDESDDERMFNARMQHSCGGQNPLLRADAESSNPRGLTRPSAR